jgi:DNA-binding CsgD family transcriptional regulator
LQTDPTNDRRLLGGLLAAFVAVALFATIDIAADLREGTTVRHVLFELVVILVGLLGGVVVARRLIAVLRSARAAREELASLAQRLQQTEREATRWRAEAHELLAGLSVAVDRQFERWSLSPAEKEVGLLLLKGLSHKEIAAARSITEATARQQAGAVYKKAGLSGRNDLAAFFLEDLLLPASQSR